MSHDGERKAILREMLKAAEKAMEAWDTFRGRVQGGMRVCDRCWTRLVFKNPHLGKCDRCLEVHVSSSDGLDCFGGNSC